MLRCGVPFCRICTMCHSMINVRLYNANAHIAAKPSKPIVAGTVFTPASEAFVAVAAAAELVAVAAAAELADERLAEL